MIEKHYENPKWRMLNNLPHKCDAILDDEDMQCQEMLYEYNNLRPTDLYGENGKNILKQLLGRTGNNITIRPPFRCSYGYRIEVGENFFSNFGLTILDSGKVTIGDNAFIAPNVSIYTNTHPLHPEKRNEKWDIGIDVSIGDNVWIGGNTIILPGVHIGNNVVIGAGSVVTKNIPDNVIAVGNPCKVARTITEHDKLFYYKKFRF